MFNGRLLGGETVFRRIWTKALLFNWHDARHTPVGNFEDAGRTQRPIGFLHKRRGIDLQV